jgi:hypothetical protein
MTLLFVIVPLIFNLPEIIKKLYQRSQQPAAGLPPSDPDEAAAHVLGDGLRRGEVSAKAAAEITAAFWGANGPDRRALAYLVAGMCASGPVADKDVLAVVRSRQAAALPFADGQIPPLGEGPLDVDLPREGIRQLRDRV